MYFVPLRMFAERNQDLTEKAFLTHVQEPHLVSLPLEGSQFTIPEHRPTTRTFNKKDTVRENPNSPRTFEVFWIEKGWAVPLKRSDSPALELINVGRTSENDMVIPLPGISKYHASFLHWADNEIELVDGGSKNGTFVDGKRLAHREKVELKNEMVIQFGTLLKFQYLLPQTLFERLPELSKPFIETTTEPK